MNNKSVIARSFYELAEMFAVAMAIVIVIMALFIRHSPVNGHSMYPTLLGSAVSLNDEYAAPAGKNDILLVATLPSGVKKNDIVVTQSKRDMKNPYVKRVIAMGGDTLSIDFETWEVKVNGVILDEGYVNRESGVMNEESYYLTISECEIADDGSFIIPDGYVFCMGDNRNHSSDSREATVGLIDERFILGKVIYRIYPFNRIGTVK